MPLRKGKRNIGRNIRELKKSGRKQSQAVAIALDYARRHAKEISADTGAYLHGENSLLGVPGMSAGVSNANVSPNSTKRKVKRMNLKEIVGSMFPGLIQAKESKGETAGESGHGGYLVTDKDGKKHLPTEKDGKPDRGLAGGAWAALHGGYRGQKYEGEGKSEAIAKLKKLYEREGWDLPSESKEVQSQVTFTKQADGHYRWTGITTSSFDDKDGEILAQQSQVKDVERMNRTKEFGNLAWWHVGEPTASHPVPQMNPIIIGTCDFAAMDDFCRIESGIINDDRVGEALVIHAKELSLSLTFVSPDPDDEGVIRDIQTVRRSVLPQAYASNRLASFSIKEANMPMEAEKVKEFKELVGEDVAKNILAQSQSKQKEARALNLRQKEAGKMHPHMKDGKKHQHAHGLEDGETLAEHEHTKAEEEALEPMKEEKGETVEEEKKESAKEIAAVFASTPWGLKAKELGMDGVCAVLADILEKLALIQIELEQAEDRAGVQEEPGMEAVEQAMASQAKEVNETKVALANISKSLKTLTKEVAILKGDMPDGARYVPSESLDNALDPAIAKTIADGQSDKVHVKGMDDGTAEKFLKLFPEFKK